MDALLPLVLNQVRNEAGAHKQIGGATMSSFARARLFAIVILILTSPGAATAKPNPVIAVSGLCESACVFIGVTCLIWGGDSEFCDGYTAGCIHGCSVEP